MCLFIPLVVLALGLGFWAFRLAEDDPGGMGHHLPTMVGIALTLASFLFLPWVKLSPARYVVNFAPAIFGDSIPQAIVQVLQILGQHGVSRMVELLESVAGIPGWLLFLTIPTTDWFIRLTLALVPFVGVVSLLWLPLSLFVPADSAKRIIHWGQAITAGIAALFLLVEMPAINSLGTGGNLDLGFVAIILGAGMGFPVWLAWIGLILLALGGLAAATVRQEQVPDTTESIS